MAEHGNNYWEQCFSEGSFPFGPVNNMQQVFEDPQVVHSGLRQQVTHSTVGTVEQVRSLKCLLIWMLQGSTIVLLQCLGKTCAARYEDDIL